MRSLLAGRRRRIVSLGLLLLLGLVLLCVLWSSGGPRPLSSDLQAKVPKGPDASLRAQPPDDDGTAAATPAPLQWSTVARLQAAANTTTTTTTTSSTTAVEIPYQCAGDAYEDVSHFLRAYAEEHRPAAWGRRAAPLPAHRHILVVGSIATRQVAYSLVAQGSLVTVERLEGRMVNRFTFSNGAVLTEVTATYVWYSPDWARYLAHQIRSPLARFDAIVMGRLEASCNGTQHALRDLVASMPAMDCHHQPPPDLAAWVQAFRGPILSLGSLSLDDREDEVQAQAVQALLSQQPSLRDRLVFVDGRKHAVATHECAASSKKEVGMCVATGRGPRCVGAQGGLPDLVAWDVTEVLYQWVGDGLPPSAEEPPMMGQRPAATDQRVCRAPQIVAPNYPWDMRPPISIFYQCQGPRYFAFGQVVEAYRNTSQAEHAATWGRRPTALPPHANVLLWGNSHTRQVGRTLVCQYADQLVSARLVDSKLGLVRPPTPDGVVTKGAEVYEFANGARLTLLTNSYVPYSRNWTLLLRDELEGHALTDFDALVLGHFNQCGGNNTFSTELEELSQFLPDVDCRFTPPPSVTEITDAFGHRPVVFVSMFDETRLDEAQLVAKECALWDQVTFVDARAVVTRVAPSICLSTKRNSVADCRNLEDALKEGVILHACTGPYGGYVDLVAWLVLESLWKDLVKTGV
jgi:hypothetical protein